MDTSQRSIVEKNKSQLIKNLHAEDLLPHLQCLTKEDKDRIKHEHTDSSKNALLLEILQTREGSWQQLVQVLANQNQNFLAASLTGGLETCAAQQEMPSLLKEFKQRLIKFYQVQFASYQSLFFPAVTENIGEIYVHGSWLDLSRVRNVSSQRTVRETLENFYEGNSDCLANIPCPKFHNHNDILQIIQANHKQRALVAGDAGVGKTTFIKKLCLEWAQSANNPKTEASDHQLSRYEFVFAIQLRNVEKVGTLPELALRFLNKYIGHGYSDELAKLIEAHCNNCPEKILFLLDGLDEYKRLLDIKLGQNKLGYVTLETILSGDKDYVEISPCLPGTIIITTRPKAAKYATAVGIYFKLIGFAADSTNAYIGTFFASPKAKDKIPIVEKALKKHPYFGTIPLLLMLICHLVDYGVEIPTGHRNEIYDKICYMMFKRACESGRIHIDISGNWKQLEITHQLMHLAFHGQLNGKVYFSMKELKESKVESETARQLGLLREDFFFSLENINFESMSHSDQFFFPHRTFQEYFASEFVRSLDKSRRHLSSSLIQLCRAARRLPTNKDLLKQFYEKLNTTAAGYACEHDLADYLTAIRYRCGADDLSLAYKIAIENSSHHCINVLDELGVNNREIYKDCRPLIRAVQLGNIRTVKILLKNEHNINDPDKRGYTPLMVATEANNEKLVELLLANGAEIDKADNAGQTALFKAAWVRNGEMVKFLLARGAQIDKVDEIGHTALIRAAMSGDTETLDLLIANGAEIDKMTNFGQTALMEAALNNKKAETLRLLANGAKVNKMDNSGQTALMKAASNNNLDIVKILLESGAQIDQADECGHTALTKAAQNGAAETLELLIAKGADVTKATISGQQI